MLTSLSIRDIVLIERLDIEFSTGLTVLTGETGAGKSILLDSLSLALGGRGDGGLVRQGSEQGKVTAVFEIPKTHPIITFLMDQDIDFMDAGQVELILKRLQNTDGRSKAYVNDQPVSVGLMRELGKQLVELHGQHDERAMLDPAIHRALIDAFGGLEGQVGVVGEKWNVWQNLKKEHKAFKAKIAEVAREAEYLKASVEELTLLAPEPGEETALADSRQKMMKVEQIATDLNEASEVLTGKGSPIPTLANLAKNLSRKMDQVPGLLDEAIKQLDVGLDALYAAQQSIDVAVRDTYYDPKDLENSEERLFALRAASRKYSVAVENLPDLAVKLADDLENLNAGEEKLGAMEKQLAEFEAAYFDEAEILSKARADIASTLVQQVMKELPALKLEQASFLIEHKAEIETAGSEGVDQMEFWVRTNPGSKSGPMVKIASGGELSRFLLALKVALADKGSAPSLVFDEIDTGVGGAVADAIGRRLHELSKKVQVMSVTHAPQVAARAENHFVISKAATVSSSEQNSSTVTSVSPIYDNDRREEIARMLAGASITDEARAAAEQLMNQSAA
ncbi:MAG: DNA repair protein RecN [Nitratireductor sp.]